MELSLLSNKNIALLLVNTEIENDMHVYLGKIEKVASDYYFKNKDKGWCVSLNNEQLSRLQTVKEELKDIFLGAEYYITLYTSTISDAETSDVIPTGLKWH